MKISTMQRQNEVCFDAVRMAVMQLTSIKSSRVIIPNWAWSHARRICTAWSKSLRVGSGYGLEIINKNDFQLMYSLLMDSVFVNSSNWFDAKRMKIHRNAIINYYSQAIPPLATLLLCSTSSASHSKQAQRAESLPDYNYYWDYAKWTAMANFPIPVPVAKQTSGNPP